MVDDLTFGPAMRSLTEKQRNFVLAMLDEPLAAHHRWAERAGYGGRNEVLRVTACQLLQMPKIQAACLECGREFLHGIGPIVAATGLLKIASTPDHPKHFAALESIADRVGMPKTTEHRVLVDDARRDPAVLVGRIQELAARLGIDAASYWARMRRGLS
jgi:hypothetical protein